MKTVATTIWFNPAPEFAGNIASYAGAVDHVAVIDNSDGDNGHLLAGMDGVSYHPQRRNTGIAAALNEGFRIAGDMGADWVLSMDQDSAFPPGQIDALLARLAEVAPQSDVAVLAPAIGDHPAQGLEEAELVITSGSLNRLSAHRAINGFNESLFIDQVDFDYCCRLRRAGLRILLDGGVRLAHNLGTPLKRRFLWREFESDNHAPARRYYQTRNRLFTDAAYPELKGMGRRWIRQDILRILFLERDKRAKLRAVWRGYRDYRAGRFGEWRESES